MKRRLFSALLLAAAVMSSCSKSEVYEVFPESDNVDVISINTAVGATRAVDTSDASLQSKGVTLYYCDAGVEDDASAGSISFSHSEGWTAGSDVYWGDIDFPAYFYSAHNGTAAQTITVADGGATAALASFDVNTDPISQVDLVYYASKLAEMPTGGTINAVHTHALSKVSIQAACGLKTLQVASIVFKNVPDEAVATLSSTAGVDWGTPTSKDDYEFLTFNTLPMTVSDNTNSDTAVVSISGGTTMMIIPQKFSWAGSTFASATDPYVEVIYYATLNNEQSIGYSAVANYPDYKGATVGGVAYTGPLYVKVAFPIPVDTELLANTPYYLTLGLGADGTTGGVSLSTEYVDASGSAVTITLNSGSDVTEPLPGVGEDLTPDANDTTISITASVLSWDEFDTVTLN